jgi:putative FmdB family regulatory protein
MPIYEYRCQACGAISEYLVGMRDDEQIQCKTCGSQAVSRILSAGSFTLHRTQSAHGHTCCGREERCETPPCSDGDSCRRG